MVSRQTDFSCWCSHSAGAPLVVLGYVILTISVNVCYHGTLRSCQGLRAVLTFLRSLVFCHLNTGTFETGQSREAHADDFEYKKHIQPVEENQTNLDPSWFRLRYRMIQVCQVFPGMVDCLHTVCPTYTGRAVS